MSHDVLYGVVDILVAVQRSKIVCIRPDESEWPSNHVDIRSVSAIEVSASTYSPFRMNWLPCTDTKPSLLQVKFDTVGVGAGGVLFAEVHLAQKAITSAGTSERSRTILQLSNQSRA